MDLLDEPPSKIMKLLPDVAATSSKVIADLPDTFVEQIFRHLDITSLFVITAVNRTFNRCVRQALKETTHLAVRHDLRSNKLDVNLLPGSSVPLDTPCTYKQHCFPKNNIITLFCQRYSNEQIVVNILEKVPNLVVLHLELDFGFYPVSTRKESVENYERCGQTDHFISRDCNHRRLPASVAKSIGNCWKLVHISINGFDNSSRSVTVTPIRWKNVSTITCFAYGRHKRDSKITKFPNLKFLRGVVLHEEVLRTVLKNGLVGMSPLLFPIWIPNLTYAVNVECLNTTGINQEELHLSIASSFKNLKKIKIRGGLSVLKCFAGLEHLECLLLTLVIATEKVDEAIDCFKSFGHRLKGLVYTVSHELDIISVLAFCPNLEHLEISREILLTDIQHFENLTKLRFLRVSSIRNPSATKQFMDLLTTLPSLRFLEVGHGYHNCQLKIDLLRNLKAVFPKHVAVLNNNNNNLTNLPKPRTT